MNRLLFNVGKTVAAGGAASASIKHAENRAQTRIKQVLLINYDYCLTLDLCF